MSELERDGKNKTITENRFCKSNLVKAWQGTRKRQTNREKERVIHEVKTGGWP